MTWVESQYRALWSVAWVLWVSEPFGEPIYLWIPESNLLVQIYGGQTRKTAWLISSPGSGDLIMHNIWIMVNNIVLYT